MSIITTYYEKLIGDILNKLFIDMKKFILQDKFMNDYNKRVDEFEKLMENYLLVVADLKRVKSGTEDTQNTNRNTVRGVMKKGVPTKKDAGNIVGDISGDIMLIVAIIGLVCNILMGQILHSHV